MTTANKLDLVFSTKEGLKAKLNLGNEVPFSNYINYINLPTITHLFEDGEQGVIYDPSDLGTLFQDSAGTVPVTKDGDPVGLVLDKSQNLEENFIVNVTGTPIPTSAYSAATIKDGINLTGNYKVRLSIPSLAVGQTAEIRFRYWQNAGVDEYGPMVTITGGQSLVINIAFSTCTKVQVQIFYENTLGTLDTQIFSVKGNHAVQTLSSKRPVYQTGDSRGVVNFIKWSEDFSKSSWTLYDALLTPNAVMSPSGTLTGTKLIANSTSNYHFLQCSTTTPQNKVISVYAKAAEYKGLTISISNNPWVPNEVHVDLSTGTIISKGSTVNTATVTPVGDGWYRITAHTISTEDFKFILSVTDGVNRIFSGDGTSGIYIWGAQFETGIISTAYQRNDIHLGGIGTGKDSDLCWLYFDGIDDCMQAIDVDFSTSDAISIVAPITKQTTTATVLVELDLVNVGTFLIGLGGFSSGQDVFQFNEYSTNGIVRSGQNLTGKSLWFARANILGSKQLRINGALLAETHWPSTGTLTKNTLYIGSRRGTGAFFKGEVYGLAVVDKYLSDEVTHQSEEYFARKSGIIL